MNKKFMLVCLVVFVLVTSMFLSPVKGVQAGRPTNSPTSSTSPTQTPNPTQPGNEIPSETGKWVVCKVPYGNPANAHYVWVAWEAIENWNEETHSGDIVWGPVGPGAPARGSKCAAPVPVPTGTPTTVVTPSKTPTPVITRTPSSDLSQTPTVGSLSCAEFLAYDQDDQKGGTDIVVRSVTRPGGLPVFGKASILTPQTGYANNPSIDPNGSCRVAYQLGSDYPEIHIMNLDGTQDWKVVNGLQPDWGIGEFIVFRDSDGYIVRVDENGKNPITLATGENPDISPSGQWVAYETRSHTLGIVWSNGITDASVLSLKKNGRYETNLECLNPTWDPDGTAVICSTERGLEYNAGTFQTPLYGNGTDIAIDPSQITLHAVLIEKIDSEPTQAWLVPHYFRLSELKNLTGTSLGQWISNPSWWSPELLKVTHDSFMDAFIK